MSFQDDCLDMYNITGNWLNLDERRVINLDPELHAQFDMVVHITELAKEYHDRCDAYDRQVCTGKNRYGEPMPATTYQHVAVNKNAHDVIKDIMTRANGIPKSLIMAAIRNYKF